MGAQALLDRVAIVTGASQGLGEGIVKAIAREGANTVLFSRDLCKLRRNEEYIRNLGQKAISFKVDITDASQVDQAVQEVLKQFGKIDILVNNAGIYPSIPFLKISDEIRDSVIDTNFKGMWNCTKSVLQSMIENKYGKIINISSVTGPMVSLKGMTIYSASKGAVSGFTKSLALEVAEYGINANAVCPGFFDTPGVRKMVDYSIYESEDKFITELQKSIPLGRLGALDDIGNIVVFLASEYSSYITGTEIVIDGGNIIQELKNSK